MGGCTGVACLEGLFRTKTVGRGSLLAVFSLSVAIFLMSGSFCAKEKQVQGGVHDRILTFFGVSFLF